ncbi:MAG TPA: hypothetical protein VMV10_32835 [Pirellulales bacterium]|nr:hypothetical protein [Pirellulales bacterium]
MCAKYEEVGTGGATAGGSADHSVSMQATGGGGLTSSGSALLGVTRHWTYLLASAEKLYQAQHYGAAAVVAQSACEVVMSRAIAASLKQHKIQDLVGDFIGESFAYSGYSPINEKVPKLYRKLAGDTIGDGEKPDYWSRLNALAKLRNNCAHSGIDCTREQAEAGIEAAKQFVGHIEEHNNLKG